MTKKLNTDAVANELNQSAFFQRPAQQEPKEDQTTKQVLNQERNTDVTPDVVTSMLEDVDLKGWREVIENTETHNSALRVTSEERYAVEDVVNELRRKFGIKTSMNEIARLGLLLLVQDFKRSKKNSLLHKVKKA